MLHLYTRQHAFLLSHNIHAAALLRSQHADLQSFASYRFVRMGTETHAPVAAICRRSEVRHPGQEKEAGRRQISVIRSPGPMTAPAPDSQTLEGCVAGERGRASGEADLPGMGVREPLAICEKFIFRASVMV